MKTIAVLSATLVMCSACVQGAGSGGADSAAAVSAIGNLRDQFTKGFQAGDAAAIAALYTGDGMTQPNMQPTGTGTQGIADSFKGFFSQGTLSNVSITPSKTEVSGNLAYETGTYKFTMVAKPKGDTVKAEGRYLLAFRKEAGTWKVVTDMDNVTAPPPGMPGMAAPPPPAGDMKKAAPPATKKGETKKGG
jgi:ketosteroid isomerase-like protein